MVRKKYGPYQEIPVKFEHADRHIFKGYLTDPKFNLDYDQIEVKPVSLSTTDGLVLKLSAIECSSLDHVYKYRDFEFVIEKPNLEEELLRLALSTLFFSYVLYTQIKESIRLSARAAEAIGNSAGLSFGTAAALVIEIAAQIIFLATTVIALIKYVIELEELIAPRKRIAKVLTIHELCRAPLEDIGYELITDIPDMKKDAHWSSGRVDRDEHFPRSIDVCGNALGCLNFAVKKYNARIFVRDKTVYIVNYYSKLYFNEKALVLEDFDRGEYTENIDDMPGTREHLYAIDYNDKYTVENFKGTEYIIRANVKDKKKSTIKGIRTKNYGVALCSRKNELTELEKKWNIFANLANSVFRALGGQGKALKLADRIGFGKISSNTLGVAKIIRLEGSRLPENHRELLSAKNDEKQFHWVESHVRNPRAKTKIYTDKLQRYNDSSLSCNLFTNRVSTPEGVSGTLTKVDWEKSYDNALLSFEVEDVNRDTKLIEEFYERKDAI